MKKILWVIIALSLFTIAWQVSDIVGMRLASAETVPQMRLRLFAEARARHPDVWDNCDAACVQARVNTAPLIFSGSAKQANVPIADFAKYSIVRDYEWGQEFENMNKRPPTLYDWGVSYVSRTARYPQELAYAPQIFVWVSPNMDEWRVKRLEYAD